MKIRFGFGQVNDIIKKMKLIIGLGNPGEKYEKTRHNLGFLVLDRFLRDFSQVQKTIWEESKKFKCEISQIEWQRRSSHGSSVQALVEKVILIKPKTYMNNSGLAVSLLSSFYKIKPSDIWIIHDDIDLPLGSMRIRFGGSAGGHKGIESIIKSLGTEKSWRFRMGIGQSRTRLEDKKNKFIKKVDEFVLDKFSHEEKGKVGELIKKGSRAIEMGLEEGLDKTMNKYNTK